DELALVGGEEAVGDVDGDALLALGGEAIDQQREIDALVADGAVTALLAQRGELVVEDQLAVVEQPADQGGLAIIDRTAGEKAQQRLAGLLGEPEVEGGFGGGGDLHAGHRYFPPPRPSP